MRSGISQRQYATQERDVQEQTDLESVLESLSHAVEGDTSGFLRARVRGAALGQCRFQGTPFQPVPTPSSALRPPSSAGRRIWMAVSLD